VLQQLGIALDVAGQRTADGWLREAERLALYWQELNGLVESLHQPYAIGLTVFDAIGTCISKAGKAPSSMPWADALQHKREDLENLREIARSMGR